MTNDKRPMTNPPKTLDQILVGAVPHDAITDHALLMRRWLREMGYLSDIYALHIHPTMAREIRPLASYRPSSAAPYVIFHHSIGSEVAETVMSWPVQLIMVYHNITPAHFFEHSNPFWAAQMRLGREQLVALRPRTIFAIGDSPYNTAELAELGYKKAAVVPITFATAEYDLPIDEELAADLRQTGPNLLFVGRIAANKKQEDLIKLLYYYRRIAPTARLHLVGDHWLESYATWMWDLAEVLGLKVAVSMPGRVSQQQLVTYYRTADLYVSMSEHEGFGKPYIESMYLGLPVLAYHAASTPDVLGDAAVLFGQKDYERLAEVVDLLVTDGAWRERIIGRQRQRLANFTETAAQTAFQTALAQLFQPSL